MANAADGTGRERVSIPLTEVRELRSKFNGQDYVLSIALPDASQLFGSVGAASGSARRFPVLFALDGNGLFGMVTDIVRGLSMMAEIPPVLIVGIGYPVDHIMQTWFMRLRDYMPTYDPHSEFISQPLKGTAVDARPGRADLFLRFIREELMPFIANEYPADADDAAVIGTSAGGLFGLYALLNQPDAFKRYVIGSPSVGWDDGVILRQEAKYAESHRDMPARVFMGAGSLENEAGFRQLLGKMPEQMRQGMERHGHNNTVEWMEQLIVSLRSRNYPGLQLTSKLFDDETHMSNVPMTFARGLKVVYAD